MSDNIVHGLPVSERDNMEQALFRGKISAFEDICGIAEDLESYREAQKGE